MSGAILQPPTRDDADWGVLFIEVSGCLPMCGHGTIGVATVLVETGMVEVTEPETVVRLDTPAGLVEARVAVEGGRARAAVTIRNVPAFLHARDQVAVDGGWARAYDMAFGGNFYALVEAAAGRRGGRPGARGRADRARRARSWPRSTRADRPCTRSTSASPAATTSSSTRRGATARDARSATAIHPGWLDRSPCGTGTSARMAAAARARRARRSASRSSTSR